MAFLVSELSSKEVCNYSKKKKKKTKTKKLAPVLLRSLQLVFIFSWKETVSYILYMQSLEKEW